MYPIEHGIPIPGTTNGQKSKYPFEAMEFGDSFFVPEKLTRGRQNSLYVIAKRKGLKVSIRPWMQGQTEGFRVWMIGIRESGPWKNRRDRMAEAKKLKNEKTTVNQKSKENIAAPEWS